jgi:NADH-quinone oxidoreductase subunit A
MFYDYFPIFLLVLFAALMAIALPAISALLGESKPSKTKAFTYECGCTDIDSPGKRTNIRYYILAILFVLFDIEAAFLYPLAVVFRKLPTFLFVEMVVFVLILLAGYIYLWRKGALDWE